MVRKRRSGSAASESQLNGGNRPSDSEGQAEDRGRRASTVVTSSSHAAGRMANGGVPNGTVASGRTTGASGVAKGDGGGRGASPSHARPPIPPTAPSSRARKPVETVRSFRIRDMADSIATDDEGAGGAGGAARKLRGLGGSGSGSKGKRLVSKRRIAQFTVAALLVLGAGLWLNLESLAGLQEPLSDLIGKNIPSFEDLTVSIPSLPNQLQMPLLEAWQEQLNGTLSGLKSQFSFSTSSDGRPHEAAGCQAAAKGWKAKHPVVIVPGFVTSALELWSGRDCAKRYFRQRMWGTIGMMQAYLRDAECWFKHMSLNPVTGLDPDGIRIRASNGLEAIDYFVQGYWVWSRLLEALGDIGYESNMLVAMSYDWRLAIPLLEVRDGYFTRLRTQVETMYHLHNEKIVLISHSYGENVARAFYTWADADEPGWVDKHLEGYVNIAGSALGIPKAVTAILSGEMRDTAQLATLASYLANSVIPLESRARLFRTWASLLAMLPVGGPRVWGNGTWAPDDTPEVKAMNHSFGAFLTLLKLDEAGHNSNNTGGNTSNTSRNSHATAAAHPHGGAHTHGEQAGLGVVGAGTTTTVAAVTAAAATYATARRVGVKTETGLGLGATAAAVTGAVTGAAVGLGDRHAWGMTEGAVSDKTSGPSGDRSGHGIRGIVNNATTSNWGVKILHKGANAGGVGTAAGLGNADVLLGNAASDAEASGLGAALRGIFSWGAEQPPAPPVAEREVFLVDQAIKLALDTAGPLVAQHYSKWGPQQEFNTTGVVHSGGKHGSDDISVNGSMNPSNRGEDGKGLRQGLKRYVPFPDATVIPLPHAPSFKIYCMYGTGLKTERSYHYIHQTPKPVPNADNSSQTGLDEGGGTDDRTSGEKQDDKDVTAMGKGKRCNRKGCHGSESGVEGGPGSKVADKDEGQGLKKEGGEMGANKSGGKGASKSGTAGNSSSGGSSKGGNSSEHSGDNADDDGGSGSSSGDGLLGNFDWRIDTSLTNQTADLGKGVQMGDGDLTVPLISLGAMCHKGWRTKRLNPSGIRIVTREFQHAPEAFDMRGGSSSAQHVDIMGNEALLMDILAVVSGHGHELQDQIYSDIAKITANIDFENWD